MNKSCVIISLIDELAGLLDIRSTETQDHTGIIILSLELNMKLGYAFKVSSLTQHLVREHTRFQSAHGALEGHPGSNNLSSHTMLN